MPMSNKIPTREEIQELHRTAEKGTAHAQYNLGFLYATGKGVPQDYNKAVELTRKAADWGHAGAQYGLGYMYVNGKGVKKDYAEAVKLYERAAAQEHKKAQFWLGYMLANGRGVPRDYVQAHFWLNCAAEQGVKNAAKLKAAIEKNMTAQQRFEAKERKDERDVLRYIERRKADWDAEDREIRRRGGYRDEADSEDGYDMQEDWGDNLDDGGSEFWEDYFSLPER